MMTDNAKHSSTEVDLREITQKLKEGVRYLKRKWLVVVFFGMVGGAGGIFYAWSQKTFYVAQFSFAMEDDKGGGGLSGALGIASTLGFDLGSNAGGAFSGGNLIELMKSRSLVEQTLLDTVTVNHQTITLAEMYLQFKGWRSQWAKSAPAVDAQIQFKPGIDRAEYAIAQDSVLDMIYSGIVDKTMNIGLRDKKLSIIDLEIKTENELFSKWFVERLVKKVSTYYIESKSSKSRLNVSLLQKQSDSVRNELNNAIAGVAVANDNTYNLNPSLNVNRVPSSRRQVDIQANTAILLELVKNLELARVSLRKETPLFQVIDMPILPLKKERLGKMKAMMAGGILAGFICVISLMIKKINE